MNRKPAGSLPRRFLRMCRRNLRRPKVADSTGAELTGAGLLTRTLVLRRLLARHVLGKDERYVGVLIDGPDDWMGSIKRVQIMDSAEGHLRGSVVES